MTVFRNLMNWEFLFSSFFFLNRKSIFCNSGWIIVNSDVSLFCFVLSCLGPAGWLVVWVVASQALSPCGDVSAAATPPGGSCAHAQQKISSLFYQICFENISLSSDDVHSRSGSTLASPNSSLLRSKCSGHLIYLTEDRSPAVVFILIFSWSTLFRN